MTKVQKDQLGHAVFGFVAGIGFTVVGYIVVGAFASALDDHINTLAREQAREEMNWHSMPSEHLILGSDGTVRTR
jgi:hypothetical protein